VNRENIVRMTAGIHPGWHFAPAAARATLIYLGSKRFVLLLIELFCAVGVLGAYRAPQGKRWATTRSQWVVVLRDAFIVIFSIGIAVFGYEIMWNQPTQSRLRNFEDSRSNPLAWFDRVSTSFALGSTDVFLRNDRRPICIEVHLPQDFSGGSYTLPFKPVPPSPPALYKNGSPQRKGIDYTVSDSTIVVNLRPTAKDSLSVWYTTNDRIPRMLP
jgi:hypothetical protein